MPASRIAALVLLAGAMAGCAASPTASTSGADDNATEIKLGWIKVSDGRTMDLPTGEVVRGRVPSSTEGTVLIIFWGSWCVPCKDEMPLLQRLADGTNIQVIGVSRDQYEKYADELLDATGAKFPNVLDPDGDYMSQFSDVMPREALPSSVLMVHGRVVAAHIGPFKRWSDLTTDRPV